MDQISTAVSGIILFVIFSFLRWYIKRQKFCNLVDLVPGPTAYPLIGTTYAFFGKTRDELFTVVNQRTAIYPYIHRIWIGPVAEVRVSKAEYVEQVLCSTKHIEKSYLYKFIKPWLGDGLLISKGDRWHNHRKIITPTFHFSILDGFCEIFAENTDVLVNKLNVHVGTGKSFDIFPYITRAALDIICETAMGTKVNAQNDTENEYVQAIYDMSELIMQRLISPWLHPEAIYKLTKVGKKFKKDLRILHQFTSNVIEDRSRARSKTAVKTEVIDDDVDGVGKKKRVAFLDLLLNASENGDSLTTDDLRQEVDTFMFEGHDTTTAGITWCLLCVGNDENVQEKIQDELHSIFGDSNRPATIQDLNEMKYLERVIKETLRLYPSVPFIGRTLSEDIIIGKYKIPKECYVGVQIFNLHRDPAYFPDPEKFDPDRFLQENTISRHPYAYIPFSAGPRNCIGQKFALLEEKSILSSIFRNYKIRAADKREDMILLNELILRPKGGVKLFLESRR